MKKTIKNKRSRARKRVPNSNPICRYYDYHFSATSATTTIGYVQLSPIPQGGGQQERIANTVILKRIELRFNVVAANADIYSRMRFGMFIWKQNTASATPGTTSILEDVSTAGVQSPYNFEGRAYYKILYDKVFNLTGTSSAPTVNSQYVVNITLPINHRLDFNDSGTTGVGHIYFYGFSDSAITPFPTYGLTTRLWYVNC